MDSDLPETGMTPQQFAELFSAGARIELPQASSLRGRIVRGQKSEDFSMLASDGRRIVFVMGPDGLSHLLGKSPFEAVLSTGQNAAYVQGRLERGYSYKLLVFAGGDAAPQATWDNVMRIIKSIYADHPAVLEDLTFHGEKLQAFPFSTFVAMTGGFDIEKVDLAGPDHHLYMNLKRYLSLSSETRRASPSYLRRLLYHEMRLGTLFAGDGYTVNAQGERGMCEYVMLNGPIAQFPDHVYVDLLEAKNES